MQTILSRRLRSCRKAAGLTQWEVAVYCDITEKAYQNYERMAREPRLEILVRIADCFHVSLDYLTGRTEDRAVHR
ncbi:MAG: helix-turn-helix transcriptional regulator [Oscillospiraceae bacterium]|nr:helix-turn-helix transcriptional regulator [Oscillospiraceae bacterium]